MLGELRDGVRPADRPRSPTAATRSTTPASMATFRSTTRQELAREVVAALPLRGRCLASGPHRAPVRHRDLAVRHQDHDPLRRELHRHLAVGRHPRGRPRPVRERRRARARAIAALQSRLARVPRVAEPHVGELGRPRSAVPGRDSTRAFASGSPSSSASVDAETLYRAANKVEPSLIRVEADQVTYNLHVVMRFELELEIFEGRLELADLPEAWNARIGRVPGRRGARRRARRAPGRSLGRRARSATSPPTRSAT